MATHAHTARLPLRPPPPRNPRPTAHPTRTPTTSWCTATKPTAQAGISTSPPARAATRQTQQQHYGEQQMQPCRRAYCTHAYSNPNAYSNTNAYSNPARRQSMRHTPRRHPRPHPNRRKGSRKTSAAHCGKTQMPPPSCPPPSTANKAA